MKNAFCTFVYGSYDRFIPYYLLGIDTHYPEVSVILLYDKRLTQKYVDLIATYKQVVLIENAVDDTEWINSIEHRGAAKQSLRHLLQLKIFREFDAIYFGDVDIIHLKEPFSLFDFHFKQASDAQLPFSNKVRPLPDAPEEPSGRLTGLHYVKVEDYYIRMTPVIDKFKRDRAFQKDILKNTERNEHVLYNLCQAAFNFDPYVLLNNERPWHGMHLGLVRAKNYLDNQTLIENSSITINDLKSQLREMNTQNSINKLLLKFQCAEVYYTYKYLNLPLSFAVRGKYIFLEKKKAVLRFLKQTKRMIFNG